MHLHSDLFIKVKYEGQKQEHQLFPFLIIQVLRSLTNKFWEDRHELGMQSMRVIRFTPLLYKNA